MSSAELPFYISTTSSETRRRHNHPQQQQNNNQQTSNKQANSAAQFPHPHSSSHQQQQQQIPQSASYGNFHSLIVPAASNFWNAAHTSIQSFTEQISSDFISASEEHRRSNSSTPSIIPVDQPIEMPFRDRTSEFRTVAKSCQLRQQPPDGNFQSRKAEREKVLQSSVQFNQLAKRIGRDLGMTCAKMEKLSQLAKNKSIFDDRAGEIEELSMTIKQDITGLNKQIANLQQVATHRPQNELSAKQEQQCQNHSKLVVVGLQSKLASISQTFKNVLEIRTENLKMKRARRERFAQSGAIPASLPPSASNGNMGSLLLHDDMHATSNGGIGGGGSSSFALDMDQLEQHRIQEQATLIDETETYHRSRYTAMESIESSISELGTIFRQLATLVSEQGEMITRIDSNIEETAINVEAAHHELLRYFNNISRNRWLIIKVFGVLMAFFIFFVIFMT